MIASAKKYIRLRTIYKNLKNGGHLKGACDAAGVDPATLWRWRQKYPAINQRVENILNSRVQIVEDALYRAAVMEGNVTAQIFFLTNRSPDRWKDRRAVVDNKILIQNNVNPEQLDFANDRDREASQRMLEYLENKNGKHDPDKSG